MLLHDGYVEASSCAVQRRRVTGGTTTDDHQIMLNQRRTTQAGDRRAGHGATITCTVNATRRAIPHRRDEMISIRVLT